MDVHGRIVLAFTRKCLTTQSGSTIPQRSTHHCTTTPATQTKMKSPTKTFMLISKLLRTDERVGSTLVKGSDAHWANAYPLQAYATAFQNVLMGVTSGSAVNLLQATLIQTLINICYKNITYKPVLRSRVIFLNSTDIS